MTGRLIERSLFDASEARRINTTWNLWVEWGDRIKEERYDSWRRTRSLPDLTQSDQKYSIGFDVFSRTRRQCAGWLPRRKKVLFRGAAAIGSHTVWKRNSCPKDVPCSALLCSALLCFALPLLYPALIDYCRSSCAAMSHSHRGNPIVYDPPKLDTQILQKPKSGQRNAGKCIILSSRRSLMMLVAARYAVDR